jgi:hypothetical protein
MMDVASVQKGQLDDFSGQLNSFTKLSGERLDGVRVESAGSAKELREQVVATLTNISDTTTRSMREWADIHCAFCERQCSPSIEVPDSPSVT